MEDRLIDDDRVDRRNIDAGFNNRRAEKHIVLMLIEILHIFFKHGFAHLSMGGDNPGFGHKSLELPGDLLHARDAPGDEIDLAAALQFL